MGDTTERASDRTPPLGDANDRLRMYHDLLDGLSFLVGLISIDGIVVDANRIATSVPGLTPEDFVGKYLWDTYQWSHARCSREMMRAAVEAAAQGEVTRGDFIVRAGEERFIVIDATFGPLRDQEGRITHIVVSGVDVTERVRHAEEARAVRHKLETAQRIASIGSWQWDFATGNLIWSQQCYQMVGWAPSTKTTIETLRAAVHVEDRAKFDQAMKRAVDEGAKADFDLRIVRPDGEVCVLHQLGEVERDVLGKPVRMIGTSRDVTVLRNTCEELVDARLRAESASQTKSRFIANMSHELRTPLNAIIGFSELLINHEDVPAHKCREYLNDIRASGTRLLAIINDILDISRIEAGKVEMLEEDVPPAELLDTTLRMVRTHADEAGVTIECHADETAPRLFADRRLMTQALLNFASNAVKFTPAGGKVDMRTAVRADGSTQFVVEDTGVGMSPEDVAQVGQPFLQADGRLSRKYEGTGLGLVIAKRLIELHGGELKVESAPGKGTAVTVVLPQARTLRPKALAVA